MGWLSRLAADSFKKRIGRLYREDVRRLLPYYGRKDDLAVGILGVLNIHGIAWHYAVRQSDKYGRYDGFEGYVTLRGWEDELLTELALLLQQDPAEVLPARDRFRRKLGRLTRDDLLGTS